MSDHKVLKDFLESACSPKTLKSNRISKGYDGCLTIKVLRALATAYNKDHLDNPINFSKDTSKKDLNRVLQERFAGVCGEDNHAVCWVNKLQVRDSGIVEEVHNNSPVPRPKDWNYDPNQWLTNFDIQKYLNQYNRNDFKFLGVYPIDFNQKTALNRCIIDEMCTFSVDNYFKRGIKRFGVVFNLDRHDEPGSHWIALYCNMDPTTVNYGIYYYDSVSQTIPTSIHAFANNVKKQVLERENNASKKFKIHWNKVRHQYSNTECGMFSCTFLTCMILANNTPFAKLMKNKEIFNDKYMTNLRRKLFVNYK